MSKQETNDADPCAPVAPIVRSVEVKMRISEMITVLEQNLKLHGDVEIKVTWEGTLHEIDECNIYLSKKGPLYIDADENFYKSDFLA
jgi:hypothetical protein